jgi:hypothetical protein
VSRFDGVYVLSRVTWWWTSKELLVVAFQETGSLEEMLTCARHCVDEVASPGKYCSKFWRDNAPTTSWIKDSNKQLMEY